MSCLCNSEGHGVAKAGNQDAALSHAFSFPDHTKCKILIQMSSPGILQTLKIFPPPLAYQLPQTKLLAWKFT